MKLVYNFRDLGGLETEDNRKIKKGYFFRSGMLEDATPEDIEKLKSLGLKCIFDYRDLSEIDENNSIYTTLGVERFHLPASLKIDKIYKLQKHPSIKNALKKIYLQDVADGYKLLPIDNKSYQALIEAVKNHHTPILQHCSAGKDRAGIGSALILKLLGVKYDDILKDYLKSLAVEDYIKEKVGKHIPKIFRSLIFKRFKPLLIVDKLFLDAAFNSIVATYGSFENYFLSEHNLTKDDISIIRDFYLEN